MLTRKRAHSGATIKKMHGGEVFEAATLFPPGELPTKKQVIERMLNFPDYRTLGAARNVAQEVHERWVWCNVYPQHHYTIATKIQETMANFSKITRYPRKNSEPYKKLESLFLEDVEKLFDVYCSDEQQRRQMEMRHCLRMATEDYAFYEDQKTERKCRCLDDVVPMTQSELRFSRDAQQLMSSAYASASSEEPFSLIPDSNSESSILESSQLSEDSSFAPPQDSHRNQLTLQNRQRWTNLARMCERYQLSDRAGAAIATSTLQDMGMITENDKLLIIDPSKLRRERERCREEIRQKESFNFKFVTGLYFDGRKDATQTMKEGPNGKMYRSIELEEHYVLVGEPGTYYLTHLSPADGKGRTLAHEIFKVISETELFTKLTVIGIDGTALMTGKYNGAIRSLEELLKKPLQWSICLLHTNELPLRHVFMEIDGTTNSPDSFTGPIGKQLDGCVSEWPVASFKNISNVHFPDLPQAVVDDLSSDQHYAYRICMAVMIGSVDEDLQYLEVGPIVHSRWLTLASRILRLYVSKCNPSENLQSCARFCINVYFPTWFEIKKQSQIVQGAKNFFNLVHRIQRFPHSKIRSIALKVVQRNAFFAHPENVLLGMLADNEEEIRRLAVNKIHGLRGKSLQHIIPNGNFKGGYIEDGLNTEGNTSNIRLFQVPMINVNARSYHLMVNLNGTEVNQPPVIKHLTDAELEAIRTNPLRLSHPCHNQHVERHIKLVTEAATQVCGFDRRDGLIRQKLKSRKIMKKFDTKHQFTI